MNNLKEQVARLLDEWEVSYNLNEEKSRFEIDIPADNVDVSINLVYDEEGMRLHNIGCLMFNLPKERTTEVLYAINKIHNTSWELAHLYLGEKDNRLAAQASIDVPEGGLDTEVFRYFVLSTCFIVDDNFKKIMAVAFGQGTENAPEEDADAEEGGGETSE